MSEKTPRNPEVRYERTDIDEASTFRFGIWILIVTVAVAALLRPVYRFLVGREAGEQAPAATVLTVDPKAMQTPTPRLQVAPSADLAAFRAQEDALLTGYAWVDKEQGIVRIPVEEAMHIVVEQGLPSFPAPPPSPATGAGAAGGAR